MVERRFPIELLAALLAASLSGCGGPDMEKLPGPGDAIELWADGKRIQAELAIDEPSRSRGLMFRVELPPDHGMLFIWPRAMQQSFWMRNTSLPLSVAFIDDDGKVLQLNDLRPHDERRIRSKDEVRYALEMNQGWFQRNGVGPGAVFQDFRKRVGGLDAR